MVDNTHKFAPAQFLFKHWLTSAFQWNFFVVLSAQKTFPALQCCIQSGIQYLTASNSKAIPNTQCVNDYLL